MGLLLSNTEQNLETSGSHLGDVTLELIPSWVHLSLAVSVPLVAPLSLKQMVASGFLPSLQKNRPILFNQLQQTQTYHAYGLPLSWKELSGESQNSM